MIPHRLSTPAKILFDLAGAPTQPKVEEVEARCVICTESNPRTAAFDSWQGANYTDQNKLRGHGLSTRICEPCVWVHSWTPPPGWVPDEEDLRKKAEKRAAREAELLALGRVPGKARPPSLRLFAHLWAEGSGYRYADKGDKPMIRAWLRERINGEAWFAAIPDSGQKHVLPQTEIRFKAKGPIRLEELDVTIGDWTLVDVMCAALTAGMPKAELETARYSHRTWMTVPREVMRALVEMDRRWLGSSWRILAAWLAQKDKGDG